MIDSDGFRPNVGIILCNEQRKLFWGRRIGQNAWQFPQGGIDEQETPEQAMYRELEEEVGLLPQQVELIGNTRGWLRYYLPKRFIRRNCQPLCVGQKQRWFLLRVLCEESAFCLDRNAKPEFDHWRWVHYWRPVNEVVYFKRQVYTRALRELAPLLFPEGAPRQRSDWQRESRYGRQSSQRQGARR
ncbi:RNA pyrophosphohydrolase [Magnetovirga frankeli]|uniref:RNA pyrophosphohydrolase n=1 Tax=Magnetovirga frankeli TaxID=947516 RepID=UPI001293F980|nr:RNA pyrophosphohydrolase [gamma proteobacterium SS-5]